LLPLSVQPSYSYNKDLANEVLFALHPDFSAVLGDPLSPTFINERLAKFRDRLIAPTQPPTRKLSF